jgi:protein archease
MAHWEHYSHGADIGVRGLGRSVEEAFEQAAMALTAIVTDPASVQPRDTVQVHCEEPDRELLLVSWLNAIIYEMAVRKMLFGKFAVVLAGNSLTGTLIGETIDPERHELAVEAKGATVTDLKVACGNEGWLAQCIIDV